MTTATSAPLVSIVIPVFNGADHLGEAIASALAQTYPAVEVLRSTTVDRRRRDCPGGAGLRSRIRYLRQANGGSRRRSTAASRKCAATFSWLSHDDFYLPHKVERQVAAWRAFGAPCVVVGDFATVSADGGA
jgi:hypothetical protein